MPSRSASYSLSRVKLMACCWISAWPPTITAWAASPLELPPWLAASSAPEHGELDRKRDLGERLVGAHQVALRDVRDFVAEHRRDLVSLSAISISPTFMPT
jgi:hypothetical protein